MNEFAPENRPREPGTIENPIVDSQLTVEEALRPNPNFFLPKEVYERQVLLSIMYVSFDGKYHQGQIVIDKDLENDVRDFFGFLLEQNFPIGKAVPIAHEKYNFNDGLSMTDNNSSGFNPRFIGDTNRISLHGFGRAIDINPFLNPYIKDDLIEPKGAVYNLEQPGTMTALLVEFLKKRGWRWGGDYHDLKDYHHLEKLLEEVA
jgi:peptidoglycan LD-endopeptidase CwlK